MKFLILFILIQLHQAMPMNKTGEIKLLHELKEDDHLGSLIYDILSIVKPKCVVIISDQTYQKVFERVLFTDLQMQLSYFMIVLEPSEEFSTSTEYVEDIFETAGNDGCQFYIITLTNGVQASQLLVFGEKYRILNTRGLFLILHDYKLFHKDIHYLWQRIINVLFIREYTGHRKNDNGSSIPWFELSTVQYPYPIASVMVPKRVDTWRQSKFRNGAELFTDKTSDLKNQSLRVVTFTHVPAVTKIQTPGYETAKTMMNTHNNTFGGIEIEILQTLSKALNFVPDLYEAYNADVELWGSKLSDDEYTGLMGEMVNNSADIALGDLHYTQYFLQVMDLSIPYNTECLTFLTPESLSNNSWNTLILPFPSILWTTILTSLVLIALLFYALSKFHCGVNKLIFQNIKKRKMALKLEIETREPLNIGQKLNADIKYTIMRKKYELPKVEGEPVGLYLFRTIGNSFLYTYGMLLVISLPKLPTGWSLRLLTGCYWMYCILIVVAYKASMTAILANPPPRVTIDTLQELVDSKLECGGWGETNLDFFQTSTDDASRIIGAKFQIINDTDEAIDKIAKGFFALYENSHFLKQMSVKKQLSYKTAELILNESLEVHKIPKGDHNLHIMSDCLIHMPISIGLQKNSPIKSNVDKFVRRALEAGLIKKWLDDVMRSTNRLEHYFEDNDSTKAVMNMQKFFGAIVALFIGYGISFTALILEIVYFRFVIKKHPNYNKYTKQIVNYKRNTNKFGLL